MDSYNGVNLYDFEARFLDSSVLGFTTQDPLSEKYYNISPYVYVANNPLKFIDPTGMSMDDYYQTEDGRITLARGTDDNYDRLFGKDGSQIKVEDTNLLPQLAGGRGKDSAAAMTSNSNDAFNVFKFSADNTNVEWGLKGYNTENKSSGFLLSTSFDKEKVSSGDGSYDASNLFFRLHSHPAGSNNLGPSGVLTKAPNSNTYYPDNLGSDLRTMIIDFQNNPESKHYIYHIGTQGLIYYNLKTAVNKSHQNDRGHSIGIMNTADQLRRKIIGH